MGQLPVEIKIDDIKIHSYTQSVLIFSSPELKVHMVSL